MAPIIKLLLDYHHGRPVDAYDCACALFEKGVDAPVLRKMVRIGNGAHLTDGDLTDLCSLIGRPELKKLSCVRREIESHLNRDYLDGKIDGWNLIQQCCDLYWDQIEPDHGSSAFWRAVADDADQHGGECCIDFPFDSENFDVVLRKAILENGRPVAEEAAEP